MKTRVVKYKNKYYYLPTKDNITVEDEFLNLHSKNCIINHLDSTLVEFVDDDDFNDDNYETKLNDLK